MTGSGKTGLCIALLEEAAIDGVPAIADRPQGRPRQPAAHLPRPRAGRLRALGRRRTTRRARGVDRRRVRRAARRERWKKGLADVGPGRRRASRRLRAAADFAIYTPGSDAGLPLSILASFAAPPEPIRDDAERAARARSRTTATGLLGAARHRRRSRCRAASTSCSPRSCDDAWSEGRDLDLAGADPRASRSRRSTRVGVLDLESFFPAKDRFALAMRRQQPARLARLRRLAATASRSTSSALLYTADGKPRISIFSIAHLSRRGADVLRHAAAQPDASAGCAASRAPPACAPSSTWTRSSATCRRSPSRRRSAAADAAQAGARLRPRRRAGDAEPRRPRLQGPRQRRHLVPRPAADRARQGAAARRPRGRAGRRRASTAPRRSDAIAGLGKRVFLLHDVHEDGPVVLRDPLGDVLPARAR